MIQKNWQELIKPKKLDIVLSEASRKVATVVAEPLERGFGQTLGNSLRRVLLSSLQGAAITSIHIDGVLHEFSSIPGVREDVVDIVLNVKDIAVKMQGDGVKRLVLKRRGPGAVTASDIQTTGDIQILNPSLVICTLDEGADLRIEFTVTTGKGYVPADRNRARRAGPGGLRRLGLRLRPGPRWLPGRRARHGHQARAVAPGGARRVHPRRFHPRRGQRHGDLPGRAPPSGQP